MRTRTRTIPAGIVSRYPIYNLLGDWNKAAWHKYSRNIELHNQCVFLHSHPPLPRVRASRQTPDADSGRTLRWDSRCRLMSTILSHPAPRFGETIRIESPDDDVDFICTFPGALEWGRGLIGIDFTMWPLFKTLSVDNILTICEVSVCARSLTAYLPRCTSRAGNERKLTLLTFLVLLWNYPGRALAWRTCAIPIPASILARSGSRDDQVPSRAPRLAGRR